MSGLRDRRLMGWSKEHVKRETLSSCATQGQLLVLIDSFVRPSYDYLCSSYTQYLRENGVPLQYPPRVHFPISHVPVCTGASTPHSDPDHPLAPISTEP